MNTLLFVNICYSDSLVVNAAVRALANAKHERSKVICRPTINNPQYIENRTKIAETNDFLSRNANITLLNKYFISSFPKVKPRTYTKIISNIR